MVGASCIGMFWADSALAISWTFWDTYSSSGVPSKLTDNSTKLPSDLRNKLLALLPEGQNINNNAKSKALIDDDQGANIFLKADATVTISYIAEGAGYLNSLAFFNFNTADFDNVTALNNSTIKDKVIFPNFSAAPDGKMYFGGTVSLNKVLANTAIGFTCISNGWKSSAKTVNGSQRSNAIFRSIKRLNPEPSTNNLNAHNVLLVDTVNEVIVVGFEDLNREKSSNNDNGYASDNDFNDVIFAIKVTPFSAVDLTHSKDIEGKTIPPTNPTPTPISAEGKSGPMSWREVTTPPAVVDPVKDARAQSRKK